MEELKHVKGAYEALGLLEEQYRGHKVKPIYGYFLQCRGRTANIQELMDQVSDCRALPYRGLLL